MCRKIKQNGGERKQSQKSGFEIKRQCQMKGSQANELKVGVTQKKSRIRADLLTHTLKKQIK